MEDTITAVEPTAMEQSEPQDPCSSQKIDLSLDDIIKLNRKEHKANQAAKKGRRVTNKNTALKKLERAGQQTFPFKHGAYQFPRGSNRSPYMRPPFPAFYRIKAYFKKAPFGVPHLKGVSPLKRAPLNTKFEKRKPLFRGTFYEPYRGPTGALRRPSPQSRGQKQQLFQPKPRQGSARPFVLNRGFPAANENIIPEKKYQKVRSWRKAPSGGSTLTVSLPNSIAIPEPSTSAKHATVTEGAGGRISQPKGIPLRFNFKATINQTGLTLNERFTCMRIRTGPGQGQQRGSGRGRGREGRTVILQ
ncbi:UAP56-interacting factor isoform X1 [Esox lucius]|uniref:Forty-two-three domain-containing protein 1 n=1 Tax=Esox lucius TaxID=8010 RepID=A0AAY5LCJ3_ESOLU|nr:UAP56-interacting factor isoform X1 [Esox lucius]